MKRFSVPAWFPSLHSWLRAVFLSSLLLFSWSLLSLIHPWEYGLKKIPEISFEVLFLGVVLLLMFPIPLISFSVEIYHQIIDFFSPQLSRTKSNRSFFPSLMSWWEGLYGWLVIILSSLVTGLIIIVFNPFILLIYQDSISSEIKIDWVIKGLLLFIWIGIAALFYEIRDLTQKRIDRQQMEVFLEQSLVEFERPSQAPFMSRQPSPKVYKYKYKIIQFKWLKKIQLNAQKFFQLLQKLLLPLLLLLGIIRSYGWVQLSQLYESTLNQQVAATSTPTPYLKATSTIKSEAPLPVPYVPKPAPKSSKLKLQMPPTLSVDPFQQAIYKATTAANLTQIAESPKEWRIIAQQWQDAIDLMETVPASNPNYSTAQQKMREYQQNFRYAQAAASGNSR